jgi:hypothetical protein
MNKSNNEPSKNRISTYVAILKGCNKTIPYVICSSDSYNGIINYFKYKIDMSSKKILKLSHSKNEKDIANELYQFETTNSENTIITNNYHGFLNCCSNGHIYIFKVYKNNKYIDIGKLLQFCGNLHI